MNEKHIRGCIRLGVEGGRIPASAMSAPIDDTLAKWNLLKNGNPTNGAVMLFSNNIEEYPQFRLRMARFLGTDKNEFIDNQRAEGNFFDLLDAGMAFFFKHLNLSGKIKMCIRDRSKIVHTGDIAFNPYRINVGSIGIVGEEFDGMLISPSYVVLRTINGLDPKVLCALLKNEFYNLYIDIYGIGTIRTSLSYTKLQHIKIPKALIGDISPINDAYNNINQLKEQIRRIEVQMQSNITEYLQ